MDSLFSTADLVQAVVLGVALAMDAMAVTLSNSLCEPDMPAPKKLAMPVMFALFQMAMPIAGFFGGTLVAPLIEAYAGIVWEAVRELHEPEQCPATRLTYGTIFFEAIATSIDAFIVGVSLAAAGANIVLYGAAIGVTTLLCCLIVLAIGRRLGAHFGPKAEIAGGIVLIIIGLRAFLS